MNKLNKEFYQRDAVTVAKDLLGKYILRRLDNNEIIKYRITETEAYCGPEDTASHARFGKTARNAIMFGEAGHTYIYLCYGIHYLLNIVTGKEDEPEAVLIRAVEGYVGPGRVTKALNIDKSLIGIDLTKADVIWLEDNEFPVQFKSDKRVGIDYATPKYKNIKWRFILK